MPLDCDINTLKYRCLGLSGYPASSLFSLIWARIAAIVVSHLYRTMASEDTPTAIRPDTTLYRINNAVQKTGWSHICDTFLKLLPLYCCVTFHPSSSILPFDVKFSDWMTSLILFNLWLKIVKAKSLLSLSNLFS